MSPPVDPMTEQEFYAKREALLRSIKRLIVVMIFVLIVVGFAVGAVDYDGRKQTQQNGYQACLRGTLNNLTNARSWRIAQQRALTQNQREFSKLYAESALDLEKRAGLRQPIGLEESRGPLIDLQEGTEEQRVAFCERAWPSASAWPW